MDIRTIGGMYDLDVGKVVPYSVLINEIWAWEKGQRYSWYVLAIGERGETIVGVWVGSSPRWVSPCARYAGLVEYVGSLICEREANASLSFLKK